MNFFSINLLRIVGCIALLAAIVSCNNAKSVAKQQKVKDEKIPMLQSSVIVTDSLKKISYSTLPLKVEQDFIPDSKELTFTIQKAILEDKKLLVSVKYGGGCKMHEFRLVYLPEKNDTMQMYLQHLTLDDRCRAYVLQDLQFDLIEIYHSVIQNASTILLNNMEVVKEEKE